MKKRVTIKDVARQADVTHTTVSRVIHNDERISEKTRRRVQRAVQALGYQPNLVARGLVKKHTEVIALVTPELTLHTLPIVQSVSKSCARRDYATMLFQKDTWEHERLSFQNVAQNWLVDGLLIYNLVYHEHVPANILELQSGRLPFVFINKFVHEKSINAVCVDNVHAVSAAIEHLAGLGRKRIGTLHGNPTSVDGMERLQAYREALAAHGLPCDEEFVECGYWYEAEARKGMRKILDRAKRPDALFCANDMMAIGAMAAIREAGLRVPEDIAVVGFDDVEAGRYIDPPLTTLRPPLHEVGTAAFDLLMEMLKDPARPPEQLRFKSELVVRGSTVRPG